MTVRFCISNPSEQVFLRCVGASRYPWRVYEQRNGRQCLKAHVSSDELTRYLSGEGLENEHYQKAFDQLVHNREVRQRLSEALLKKRLCDY